MNAINNMATTYAFKRMFKIKTYPLEALAAIYGLISCHSWAASSSYHSAYIQTMIDVENISIHLQFEHKLIDIMKFIIHICICIYIKYNIQILWKQILDSVLAYDVTADSGRLFIREYRRRQADNPWLSLASVHAIIYISIYDTSFTALTAINSNLAQIHVVAYSQWYVLNRSTLLPRC